MLRKTFLALVIVTAAAALFFVVPELTGAASSPGDALTGQVTSTEEGPMEGVLVSAKKNGSR